MGGQSDTGGLHYSSSVYKMSCANGQFSQWIEMEVQLKTPRYSFVASFIPNNLIDSKSTPWFIDVAIFLWNLKKDGFFQSHFSTANPYWEFSTTMKS